MQSIQLQNDTLIEIATFLVRRWSGKENVTVEFSKIRQNETRLKEKRVLLIPNEQYYGDDFQKYPPGFSRNPKNQGVFLKTPSWIFVNFEKIQEEIFANRK